MLSFISAIFRRPFSSVRAGSRRAVSMAGGERLGVVITGGTKGVGRALAHRFLSLNDRVVIASRDEGHVQRALISLRGEYPDGQLYGMVCDVSQFSDVQRLLHFAADTLGSIDLIVCNAGTVGGQKGSLLSQEPDDLKAVVETNLLGSLYCAKEAMRVASERQTTPLHVFLMDGSGTIGNATADYAAYGATKRSVPQLIKSLNAQAGKRGDLNNIRFHQLSPGMVLTDLLLKNNPTPQVKRIFNMLAEEPTTVAAELVPHIRETVEKDARNKYIAFLTIPKAVFRLTTGFLFGFRKNMFFDERDGRRIDSAGRYNDNGVRIN